ncbi:MAG: tetratricopeptide repeat protein [Chthoniobacterales bacterium]
MIADLELEQGAFPGVGSKQPASPDSRGETSASRSVTKTIPFPIVVFLGVFLLRLFSLARLSDTEFLVPNGGDMQFYNDWALRILHGEWTQQTAFYGLPLYAYLLAVIYKILGFSPFVPGLLQAANDAGTGVLLYKLGNCVFTGSGADQVALGRGKVVGSLAALGWALFLPAQSYSIILMPTAWLVFVFWLIVWQILKRQKAPPLWKLAALGALIGFTAMGIATILFLAPLLMAALFLRWPGPLRGRVAGVALILLGVWAGTSPAWVHNYFVAHDPVFLSAHGGVNLWIGNNPVATGYPKFPPGLHAGQRAMLQDSIVVAEQAAGRPLKRSEVSEFWSAKARAWIREHPVAWLKLIGVKIGNFWNAYCYDDITVITELRDRGITFPGPGFGVIAALGLVGMLFGCWKMPETSWIAAAVLLQMLSLLTVFVTERYRLAAVPGLLLFAGYGLWELWNALAHSKYRAAATFVVPLVFCTAFVSRPQGDSTLWALDSYNSGIHALSTEQLGLARRRLERAYAYSPDNAEVNFSLGNLCMAEEKHAKAKQFYAAALQLDQKHYGALNNLGLLAMQEKRWPLAERLLSLAADEAPNEAKTHYLLAGSHAEAGHWQKASEQIEIALRLQPGQAAFEALRRSIRNHTSTAVR